MTVPEDNELLTRVGPGTPMGRLMREYWMPAALSSELVADGPPLRLMLLGEKLIAFRDSAGRVGVMDHRCPHRCASLFYGRNEQGGLRCVYHGWKFDVAGKCLEMPNVPAHQSFADKVAAKAYRAVERNGLVWAYLGSRVEAPPLPALEPAMVAEADLEIEFVQRDCNWLQGVEGELDTSHIGFLHFGAVRGETIDAGILNKFAMVNRAPDHLAQETGYGAIYAAHRPAEAGSTYWRFGQFLFPIWTMPPIAPLPENVFARGYVPMDDEHTMIVQLARRGVYRREQTANIVGASRSRHFLPNTTDWFGRWRLTGNRGNDHLIDRAVQRRESFTGIEGVQMQDQAVQEGMGAIVDRSLEHLAPSDMMVARVRRLLLRAVRALDESGALPPAAADPACQSGVRGGHFLAPEGVDWLAAYAAELAAPPAAAE